DVPRIGIVLGSGLGDFANSVNGAVTVPYGDLPHWPASRVIGHEGKLAVGTIGGKTVAALAGRVHAYEGHGLATETFAIRTLGLVGVRTLILPHAAGGVTTGVSHGGSV